MTAYSPQMDHIDFDCAKVDDGWNAYWVSADFGSLLLCISDKRSEFYFCSAPYQATSKFRVLICRLPD